VSRYLSVLLAVMEAGLGGRRFVVAAIGAGCDGLSRHPRSGFGPVQASKRACRRVQLSPRSLLKSTPYELQPQPEVITKRTLGLAITDSAAYAVEGWALTGGRRCTQRPVPDIFRLLRTLMPDKHVNPG